MEFSAGPMPYGTDRHAIKGLHWIPAKKIRPYRVQEARVSFECAPERAVAVGRGPDAANLILGRVQPVHVNEDLPAHGNAVDWRGLDVLSRLCGNRYCAVRSVIESETH